MKKKGKENLFGNLPGCATEFVKLVIRKMGYRRKVREEVREELVCHFEDELRECESDEAREEACEKLIAEFGDAKLLGKLLRRAKKRCRPLWRTVAARTFQTVGILLLCLAVYIGWFISGEPSITTDYVAQWNRLVRPVAERNQNAAPFYIEAAGLSKEWPDDMLKLFGEKYQDVNDVQKQRIEQFLEDNRDTLELIIAGSKKPYYWHEYKIGKGSDGGMMGVLVPQLTEYRRLAYCLGYRAGIKAEGGGYEDAFDDLLACYRFGRHLEGERTLIEQLVGNGIKALSVLSIRDVVGGYDVDSKSLLALQEDLGQAVRDSDFTVSFKCEKFYMYDEIQRCFTDGLGGGHLYFPGIMDLIDMSRGYESDGLIGDLMVYIEVSGNPFYALFFHPDKHETRRGAERLFAFWDEIADKTPIQVRAEGIDVEAEVKELVEDNIFLKVMAPGLSMAIKLSYRVKADSLATLSVVAIERYRQDTGQYPSGLRQLIELGYLKELPVDPWSDEPLVYRKKDDGFILYSVGKNFTDDGGEVVRDDKGNIEKYADEGDWVFWPVGK